MGAVQVASGDEASGLSELNNGLSKMKVIQIPYFLPFFRVTGTKRKSVHPVLSSEKESVKATYEPIYIYIKLYISVNKY